MLTEITPLILTYNEGPNIGRVLERLRWASDIVVVDSFSDDNTLKIIASFPRARVYQRTFDSHANQWTFALTQTEISSEWVLALDSDYLVTKELVAELNRLAPTPEITGYVARFDYCINGKRLRSGIYPPVPVLFRRGSGSYIHDGHTHRLIIDGKVEKLSAPIWHDDRKSLTQWLQAQSRYAELEANKLLSSDRRRLGWGDRLRRARLVAPFAMLFYCLIIRGGVLDGAFGFYYAFQRAVAELILSLRLIEHDLEPSPVASEEHKRESPD